MNAIAEMEMDAVLMGDHRYLLTRAWGRGARLGWCMLNPSTADAFKNDPTIRRCIAFARAWGYDGIEVVNLFSLRSPNPRHVVANLADASGSSNHDYIAQVASRCKVIVAAWGATTWAQEEGRSVYETITHNGARVVCVGKTKSGAPRHPLYVRASTQPVEWAPTRKHA